MICKIIFVIILVSSCGCTARIGDSRNDYIYQHLEENGDINGSFITLKF